MPLPLDYSQGKGNSPFTAGRYVARILATDVNGKPVTCATSQDDDKSEQILEQDEALTS